jgi:hypothetical protein
MARPASMKTSPARTAAFVAATLLWPSASPLYAISYNENIFGDLSSDPAFPDPYELAHGFNILTASIGDGDIDVLNLMIRPYHTLDGMTLKVYSGATQSFAGLQPGNVWTAGTGGAINPASLLGWTHFGPAVAGAGVGQDIFDDMAVPKNGSAGFAPPLAGNYTLLLQDTGAAVNYQIEFLVTYRGSQVGDFNDDFIANGLDLTRWMGDYHLNGDSDANGDGDSDGADFLTWQRHLGQTFLIGAVPEPSAAASAAAVAFAVLTAARQRLQPRALPGGSRVKP